MPTFSTENTPKLEPKSPPGSLACSTIYFLLTSRSLQPTKRLAEVNARTKQYLLCKTKPICQGLLMTVTSAITRLYDKKPPLEAPKNKANSKPIGKKAATLAKLHQIRATSSEVRSSVSIRRLWPGFLRYTQPARTKQHLLCKTKPISEGLLMNLTSAITSTYEHKPPPGGAKKQSQSKTNWQKGRDPCQTSPNTSYQFRGTLLRAYKAPLAGVPPLQAPRAHKTTPFMQNKANFRRAANDCNLSYNKHLRQKNHPFDHQKTKPIQRPARTFCRQIPAFLFNRSNPARLTAESANSASNDSRLIPSTSPKSNLSLPA